MSDSSVQTPDPGESSANVVRPTLIEVLRAFVMVSLAAFGGALPWARRMVVERKRWMTGQEFNEAFALSQFLPGPNTMNFAVVFGARFAGAPGAVVAAIGLIGPSLVIVSVLGLLYERYGDQATLGHILAGIASSAAGLLIAAIAKMATPLFKRWNSGVPVAILAFIGVAIMHWPLPYVFLALAPVSIALAWFEW